MVTSLTVNPSLIWGTRLCALDLRVTITSRRYSGDPINLGMTSGNELLNFSYHQLGWATARMVFQTSFHSVAGVARASLLGYGKAILKLYDALLWTGRRSFLNTTARSINQSLALLTMATLQMASSLGTRDATPDMSQEKWLIRSDCLSSFGQHWGEWNLSLSPGNKRPAIFDLISEKCCPAMVDSYFPLPAGECEPPRLPPLLELHVSVQWMGTIGQGSITIIHEKGWKDSDWGGRVSLVGLEQMAESNAISRWK